MPGVSLHGWSALLTCCALLAATGSVHGQEHGGEGSEDITKYSVTFRSSGGEEKEETFDLSKPKDEERLADLLRQGKVKKLSPDEQPNILEIKKDVGLWTLVVFGLLFLILRKFAWQPMLEGLQRREENIRGALEEAQRARDEAQRIQQQLQREMASAQEKVRGILDAARADAQRATDEMVSKARAEIQAERDRLRREIDLARDQALQELWQQAARLATLVSAKVIRRQLSEEDHRRLVDEAIADLRKAGNQRRRETASVVS